jgi:succinyl-diaminopimelate desuccinylase
MPLDVVQALSELVRIPSEVYRHEDRVIRRNYREAAETVAKIAESAGLKVERLELEGGEVPTLVISIPDGSGGKPTVAFVSTTMSCRRRTRGKSMGKKLIRTSLYSKL